MGANLSMVCFLRLCTCATAYNYILRSHHEFLDETNDILLTKMERNILRIQSITEDDIVLESKS